MGKIAKDYFDEYMILMDNHSDKEIIDLFNRQVGIRAWNIARQGYLLAIEEQFRKRNIDFLEIGDEFSVSYKSTVVLNNKKLVKIGNLDKDEIQNLLREYFIINNPEKLKFRPTVISYNDDELRFGMAKHYGVLVLKTNNLIQLKKKYFNK